MTTTWQPGDLAMWGTTKVVVVAVYKKTVTVRYEHPRIAGTYVTTRGLAASRLSRREQNE